MTWLRRLVCRNSDRFSPVEIVGDRYVSRCLECGAVIDLGSVVS